MHSKGWSRLLIVAAAFAIGVIIGYAATRNSSYPQSHNIISAINNATPNCPHINTQNCPLMWCPPVNGTLCAPCVCRPCAASSPHKPHAAQTPSTPLHAVASTPATPPLTPTPSTSFTTTICDVPAPVLQYTNCAQPSNQRMLYPYSNMERMSQLLGPEERVAQPRRDRQLVVAVGGSNDVDMIDHSFTKWGIGTDLAASVTFMLFHYDDDVTLWKTKSWYNSVIRISVHKQMKWWYFKRFLHPDVVEPYEYIWLYDGDADTTRMDPHRFLHIMRMFKIQLANPSHCPGSVNFREKTGQSEGYDPDPNINLDNSPLGPMLWSIPGMPRSSSSSPSPSQPKYPPRDVWNTTEAHIGTWHLSVECGPVQVISRASWRCIWGLFRSDLSSGWGYDLYWGGICGQGRTAMIDAQCITHMNKKVASSEYDNAMIEFNLVGRLLDRKVIEPHWNIHERVIPATKKSVWHGPVRPIMLSDLDEPFKIQYQHLTS